MVVLNAVTYAALYDEGHRHNALLSLFGGTLRQAQEPKKGVGLFERLVRLPGDGWRDC